MTNEDAKKQKEVEEKLKEQKKKKLMTSNKLKRCSRHFRLIIKKSQFAGVENNILFNRYTAKSSS